jgi:hypothetical protein
VNAEQPAERGDIGIVAQDQGDRLGAVQPAPDHRQQAGELDRRDIRRSRQQTEFERVEGGQVRRPLPNDNGVTRGIAGCRGPVILRLLLRLRGAGRHTGQGNGSGMGRP